MPVLTVSRSPWHAKYCTGFFGYDKKESEQERIKINIEYIAWLYAKSRERKKQNKGLLDNRQTIELVIRDAGGEKALKELFLKEQDENIIEELTRLNPTIEETFKQDREAGLQALNEFIVDLEK